MRDAQSPSRVASVAPGAPSPSGTSAKGGYNFNKPVLILKIKKPLAPQRKRIFFFFFVQLSFLFCFFSLHFNLLCFRRYSVNRELVTHGAEERGPGGGTGFRRQQHDFRQSSRTPESSLPIITQRRFTIPGSYW